MTSTYTSTPLGARHGEQECSDGIYAYVNGGDYTGDECNALVRALWSRYRAEVDDRLPAGVTWQPSTASLVHPADAVVPVDEVLDEIFVEAWSAVEMRFGEIEDRALAHLSDHD